MLLLNHCYMKLMLSSSCIAALAPCICTKPELNHLQTLKASYTKGSTEIGTRGKKKGQASSAERNLAFWCVPKRSDELGMEIVTQVRNQTITNQTCILQKQSVRLKIFLPTLSFLATQPSSDLDSRTKLSAWLLWNSKVTEKKGSET